MRNSIKMIYLIFIILMLCVPVTASKTEKENTIHKGGHIHCNVKRKSEHWIYLVCNMFRRA